MATPTHALTRQSSSDSSALSNILVAVASPEKAMHEDSASEEQGPVSTPPTSVSLQDGASNASAGRKVEDEGRRSRRARGPVGTYNLKELMDRQEEQLENAGSGQKRRASGKRNTSGLTGQTLVGNGEEDEEIVKKDNGEMEVDWEAPDPSGASPRNRLQRRPSVKDRVKKAVGKVGAALGKRKRDVVEAGKRKFGKQKEAEEADEEAAEDTPKKSKWLKELDMGTRGVLDEMDLDEEYAAPPERPTKKAKRGGKELVQESSKPLVPTQPTAAPVKSVHGKGMKKWQREGLYVGQEAGFEPTQVSGGRKKLQKKSRPGTADSASTSMSETAPITKRNSFVTLPMFAYLDKTRDFTIPFDIYAPSAKKGDEKPKDWHKVNRNRLVGEAKDLWAKVEKLPPSVCTCPEPEEGQTSCEDDCLNRVMQYECNEDNCALPADQCSNRAFAELAARMKKGGAFDIGVEVLKTDKRGFGVRSCRTFAPGQIIMEYTGEIISEGECQRRMREEYKDKQCYYLMELERGLIIDGTKGSMARFINHSCAPNCEVRMVKVNGTPRMAVFTGESGVMTGEELTYDYNFDNFGTTQQQCFCGAPSCRGFLSKRLNAAETKKLVKEDEARKRKAAEEAVKAAERESKRRKVVEGRGSGWRGWVAVDDPETRERLREEKRKREEREMNSSRARRAAARRGSLPAAGVKDEEKVKKEPRRRQTVQVHQDLPAVGLDKEEESRAANDDDQDPDTVTVAQSPSTKAKPHRSASTTSQSKFHEEFTPKAKPARPLSSQTTSTTITRKTEVSISTTTSVLQRNASALALNADAAAGPENDAEEGEEVKVSSKEGVVKRTASKGKEVFRKAFSRDGGFGAAGGSGKLKQTTLKFGRA